MTLIIMTVVVIVLTVAVLAIYLFVISVPLNRTADNLGDCLQSLRTVADQANDIRPGVKRLNKTGGELLGALPLLLEDVKGLTARRTPSAATPEAAPAAAVATPADPDPAPKGVGYMDS